ncbi:PREDICTED: guanylate-binding protein 4-like [Nanorana parkeri]|uniref:guanylate-binding protein 4-like n=1 Tax=Nanorana parkeri TaxID=125878 RepID=UPI0008549563|nr:PREDICTED: guanylate-binding protein 4-like [Nanorana parkeri]
MGTINQDALDKLKFVGEITELIKVRTGSIPDEQATFSTYFPIFVWAVRDFNLELEINGQMVTEDDYLENALKLKTPERSPDDKEYNELRNRLRMYFGKRRCFVFDAPADSRKQLKDLEHLPDDRLNEDFVHQSARFCDYIFKNAEVKRVDITVDVTGHRLGELTKLYTEAINSNVVCLEEAVVSLAEKENKIAIQEASEHYENKMRTVVMPTETLQQFLDLSSRFEDEARKIFLKRSIKDKDKKFLKELMDDQLDVTARNTLCQSLSFWMQSLKTLQERINSSKLTCYCRDAEPQVQSDHKNVTKKRLDFIFANETKSREVCAALIKKHSADFERALAEGQFSILGGHAKFLQSLKALKQEYIREERKGVKAEEVLQEYLISRQAAEIIIIQEDNALTQKQKEEEEILNRKQMEEIKERLAQLEEEEKNQKSSEEMANLMKTVEQLQEMLVEERRIMNEKLEQVVKEKEMERNLYQMQEHREQAEKYDEHIRELQSLLTSANTEQFNATPIVHPASGMLLYLLDRLPPCGNGTLSITVCSNPEPVQSPSHLLILMSFSLKDLMNRKLMKSR